jgi:hypothetical protein
MDNLRRPRSQVEQFMCDRQQRLARRCQGEVSADAIEQEDVETPFEL